MSLLRAADRNWLEQVALPYFKLAECRIEERPDWSREYPDIWAHPSTRIITVTRTWYNLGSTSRRVHLAHELVHLAWGWGHGHKERAKGFYSRPARDRFTQGLYQAHLSGKRVV